MRQALAALGVGAIVCLPCLLVAGAVGVAAGGALLAFVNAPLVQGAGLVALIVAATLAWRRWRRAACAIEGCDPEPTMASPKRASRLPASANISSDERRSR